MWVTSAQNRRRDVQYRKTYFTLLLRSLIMEAVTGSSCRNPLTGPVSTPVWKGWVISPGCSPWNSILWSNICTRVLGGCSAPCMFTSNKCTCKQALLHTACCVWLLHYCGSHWYEWTHPTSFWDLLIRYIHASLTKVCGKSVGIHEGHFFMLNAGCAGLYTCSPASLPVSTSTVVRFFQHIPCNLQREQWGWATAEATWKVNEQTPFSPSMMW